MDHDRVSSGHAKNKDLTTDKPDVRQSPANAPPRQVLA